MADKKVCPKCSHDNFHSPFGCLHGSSLDGSLCKCKLDDNGVDIEILKFRIFNLETDLIHARRVADERQEIINERTKELNEVLYGELDDIVYHGDDEQWKKNIQASLNDE